jgi:hypothetical protein
VKTLPDCRGSIINVLRLLSSPEQQLAFEQSVQKAPVRVLVTTELFSIWFDDTYLPDSESFRQCFSLEELAALAAFDEYYADHEKLLPGPSGGMQSWIESDSWRDIMREAARALAALNSKSTNQK